MSDERRPVWPWIAALLIGLPVLYVASFGPACWAADLAGSGDAYVTILYRPVFRLMVSGPAPIATAIHRYANLCSSNIWTVEPVDLERLRFRAGL